MNAPSPLELSPSVADDVVTTSRALSPRRLLARLEPRLVLALAAVWLLWGSTYLAMRVAVTELPPFGMAGVRFVLAGVVLLILTRLRGEGWPTRRAWLVAVPAGGLLFLGGNGAVVLAEKTVPSSVAAVVCATTPLIAAAVAMLRGERPGRGDMLGMVLGLAGVVVLGAGAPIIGAGPCEWLVFASPVTFALGSLMVRAQGPGGGLGSAAAQMLMGGAWLLVASVAAGERAPEQVSSGVLGAWLWLVVFGSLVGFSAYTWLLRNAPPALSMSYAYVNPIVAVLLGVLLGGERLCGASIAATCLIAVGVMSAVLLRRSPSRVRVS